MTITAMINPGCRLVLATAGAFERRLSIVLFHRVLATPDPLLIHEPDAARFAEQIAWLREAFTILPLRDALDRLYTGKLPAGALSVTFDDGYRDNRLNALPVLKRLGVPATFFVTTRYVDGGMMWNDRVVEALRHWPEAELDLTAHGLGTWSLAGGRVAAMENVLSRVKYLAHAAREAVADDLLARSGAPDRQMMMNATEIHELHAAGMEIGGHTVSHPILCNLDDADGEQEIGANKRQLEDIVGAPLITFAYPNGRPQRDYDVRHVAMLRASGYRYALTTSPGAANAQTSPFQIPRFTPWDRHRWKYLVRMLRNYFVPPLYVSEQA